MGADAARETVVETFALTKRYRDVLAVDDVALSVPRGSVLGLLGPNGAGKTTIIGMLLGLIRPTAGTMSLFGSEVDGSTRGALRRIGATMETPAFYPFLSGRDNLSFFQGLSSGVDKTEINRLLDRVHLGYRADARFSTYSLGMKHRLAVAYSLLGDPDLLLLDEPTNGLDPSGMAEVRELIQELGDGERTVVLASHLLSEVEQVCDQVAILSKGRLVAQGDVATLIGGQDRLLLRTTDDERSRDIVGRLDWVESVTSDAGSLIVIADPARSWELSAALGSEGVHVAELTALETSLEEYFLDVTSDEAEAPGWEVGE